MNLSIGSGDVSALLAGKHTKAYADLMRKFVSEDKPYYNAFSSPINALRAGAILEASYMRTLSESYYTQFKVTSDEFDVLTVSLDFAKLELGKCIDFDEMKTINFADYVELILPVVDLSQKDQNEFFKKKFKANYNQLQSQLFATELDSANLVFLSVETYDDEVNYNRELFERDFKKFRIFRDEKVINEIRERLEIFQAIKNNFK